MRPIRQEFNELILTAEKAKKKGGSLGAVFKLIEELTESLSSASFFDCKCNLFLFSFNSFALICNSSFFLIISLYFRSL